MGDTAEKKEEELEMHSIANRILYEDDQVRVWDQVMEPNSELKPHRHENDYVLVDLQGAKLHVEMLPGNESEFEGEFEFEGKRGDVHIVKKGGVERAFNHSDKTYRSILIELLD
jgi:hypothetical protein